MDFAFVLSASYYGTWNDIKRAETDGQDTLKSMSRY